MFSLGPTVTEPCVEANRAKTSWCCLWTLWNPTKRGIWSGMAIPESDDPGCMICITEA